MEEKVLVTQQAGRTFLWYSWIYLLRSLKPPTADLWWYQWLLCNPSLESRDLVSRGQRQRAFKIVKPILWVFFKEQRGTRKRCHLAVLKRVMMRLGLPFVELPLTTQLTRVRGTRLVTCLAPHLKFTPLAKSQVKICHKIKVGDVITRCFCDAGMSFLIDLRKKWEVEKFREKLKTKICHFLRKKA